MVIFIYSNILSSVKYDEYDEVACEYAAKNGHLDCLKYLHETVKAPWSSYTANGAALCGHLHILEYLVERKYNKYVETACQYAAKFGHLDCLKYLHKTARAPLDYLAVREATKKNQTECLRYLLDNYGPLPYGWRYEHGELRVPESEVFSSSESESE
jgi:ankyrin repeat protein